MRELYARARHFFSAAAQVTTTVKDETVACGIERHVHKKPLAVGADVVVVTLATQSDARPATRSTEPRRPAHSRLIVDIQTRDARPVTCASERHRVADARRGADDGRDLSGQTEEIHGTHRYSSDAPACTRDGGASGRISATTVNARTAAARPHIGGVNTPIARPPLAN